MFGDSGMNHFIRGRYFRSNEISVGSLDVFYSMLGLMKDAMRRIIKSSNSIILLPSKTWNCMKERLTAL